MWEELREWAGLQHLAHILGIHLHLGNRYFPGAQRHPMFGDLAVLVPPDNVSSQDPVVDLADSKILVVSHNPHLLITPVRHDASVHNQMIVHQEDVDLRVAGTDRLMLMAFSTPGRV